MYIETAPLKEISPTIAKLGAALSSMDKFPEAQILGEELIETSDRFDKAAYSFESEEFSSEHRRQFYEIMTTLGQVAQMAISPESRSKQIHHHIGQAAEEINLQDECRMMSKTIADFLHDLPES